MISSDLVLVAQGTGSGNCERPTVDIVAVHGLNPLQDKDHSLNTWRSPGGANGNLWLRDFLPRRAPNARVFLYQYDSSPAFSKTNIAFQDQATDLLERIRVKRRECPNRPLIFVAHSLGGILVKQALVNAHANEKYSGIKKATHGLMFFGTPHAGGKQYHVALGKASARVVRALGGNPPRQLMDALESGSVYTDLLKEAWRHQLQLYQIVSFYEGAGDVVTRDSATIGLPGSVESILPLSTNHSGLCKFESEDDSNYEIVCENLLDLYDAACRKAEETLTASQLETVAAAEANGGQGYNGTLSGNNGKRTGSYSSLAIPVNVTNALSIVAQKTGNAEIRDMLSKTHFNSFHLFDYRRILEKELKKRNEKTARWIFETHKFNQWKQSPKPAFMWLQGAEGVGKTVLSTVLIEALRAEAKAMSPAKSIVLYSLHHSVFNSNGSTMLCILIHQLLDAIPELRPLAYAIGGTMSREPKKRSIPQLWFLLRSLIRNARNKIKSIYLVIDGMDFMDEKSKRRVLGELSGAERGTKVLVVTRSSGLLRSMGPASQACSLLDHFVLDLNKECLHFIKEDIGTFASEELTTLERFSDLTSTDKHHVHSHLARATSFLVARLAIEKLRSSTTSLVNCLNRVPSTLEEMLKMICQELRQKPLTHLVILLRYILYSHDSLKVEELTYACQQQENCFQQVSQREVLHTLKSCFPLVIVEKDSKKVDIFHHSIKPFIAKYLSTLNPRDPLFLQSAEAEQLMAIDCINRICVARDFQMPADETKYHTNYNTLVHEMVKSHTMLRYALQYWYKHLKKASDDAVSSGYILPQLRVALKALEKFWREPFQRQLKHIMLTYGQVEHIESTQLLRRFELLCAMGLTVFVQEILDERVKRHDPANLIEQALNLAIKGGHESLARMLISRYNITSLDGEAFEDIISSAIHHGQEEMVDLILTMRRGLPREMKNASTAVFESGNREALAVLRKHQAFQDRDEWGSTILHEEFRTPYEGGREDTREAREVREGVTTRVARVKFLVKAEGNDVNAKDEIWGSAAIHLACFNKYPADTLQALLDVGADPWSENTFGWTPVHIAACYSRDEESFAVLLKAAGPQIMGCLTPGGNSPLHWAAQPSINWSAETNCSIMKMMLKAGADPNLPNQRGDTPLMIANWSHTGTATLQMVYTRLDGVTHSAINARAIAHGESEGDTDLEFSRQRSSRNVLGFGFSSEDDV